MSTIQEQLDELATVVEASRPIIAQIDAFLPVFLKTLQNGGRILTCGNGGSAADALHLAEELVGRYRSGSSRPALSAICLSADVASITCIANDWAFDKVFSRQVEAHGREGDFLVGFSTSGNSSNVNHAMEVAKKMNIGTLALLGKDGGMCKNLADYAIVVPSSNTARIQEMHTWILHAVLEAVEEAFA